MKKKLLLIIPIILFILGVSYAFFSYFRVGESNNEIVAGQIYMKYTDSNTLYLTNIFPETREKALKEGRTDNEIRFSIKGKNEYTKEDIYYEINLNLGDEIEGRKRIRPKDVMIYLECDGEVLVDGMTFKEWDETRIWVHTIPANTLNETTKNYVLKAWVREDVLISDTNPNAEYTADDWNLSYISLKLSVYGDFVEKDLPVIGYITYDMSSLGITNPTNTPIYADKTGIITMEVTSSTLEKFLGWSTTLNGEVVYQPGDRINKADIINNNLTLYPVMQKELLVDKITSTMPLTTADVDGTRFVTGNTVDNNYVWYSGKLWRIVSIDKDGNIKLVTQGNMTTIVWSVPIVAEDGTTTYSTDYSTSQIRNWLKTEFLPTLENRDKLLADAVWDYTLDTSANTTKPSTSSSVVEKVGLLTIYDFVKTGGTTSSSTTNTFLNNGYYWWLMTPRTSGSRVWRVSSNGNANYLSPTFSSGARPSVNLKSGIIISGGTGEKTKPYTIEGDKATGTTTELLSNRISGEYINFDDTKYRIVGVETINGQQLTKVTMADYDDNKKNVLTTSQAFGASSSDVNYNTSTGIGKYMYDWYNGTSINSTYKSMIATNGIEWYTGPDDGIGYDYTLSKTGTPVATPIGLGYYGEMFSSQFGEGYGTSTNSWLMTKYSGSNVWFVYDYGNANSYSPTNSHGARPSFYLKADVKITGGTGQPGTPYEISQ